MLQKACEIFPYGLPKQFRTSQGPKCLDPTEGARIRHFSKFVPKRMKELSDPVVDSFSSGTDSHCLYKLLLDPRRGQTSRDICYRKTRTAFSPRHLPRRPLESQLAISSPLECVACRVLQARSCQVLPLH